MHIYAQGWGQGSRATIGPTPGSMGMKRRRPMTQRWSICSVFSLTAMSCCNCVRIFTMRDIVSSDWWSVSFSWRIVLYNSCTSHSSLQTAHDTIRYDTKWYIYVRSKADGTSGVARIWCQEGHMQKLLGFYRRQLSTYGRCQTLYRSKCTEKN